ncbi:MAG: rhomboid family intramembrane serine protease, partial [Tenacibaculum sp.]|nr:rhomboid family intramembrane serine protease [Tenacibaculum sp.]
GFLHSGFLHILFNLIALFFIGNLFVEYFTPKQLLNFYILGTIFGGISFILGYTYIPLLQEQNTNLVGASAGVSAILIGIATYMPNYQLKFRFIGYVKLLHIALMWVLLDLLQLSGNNAGGHLAHLGGALFGFLYVTQVSNKKIDLFSFFKKKKTNLKTVYKTNKKQPKNNNQKNEKQKQIDIILDKISKSGYDSLTKEEKEFLFKQGRK